MKREGRCDSIEPIVHFLRATCRVSLPHTSILSITIYSRQHRDQFSSSLASIELTHRLILHTNSPTPSSTKCIPFQSLRKVRRDVEEVTTPNVERIGSELNDHFFATNIAMMPSFDNHMNVLSMLSEE